MMASTSAILLLTKRAALAEELLSKVKDQLEAVRRTAILNLRKEEKDRLSRENEILKGQVADVRKQLMLSEINNGIRQIPLPSNNKKRTLQQAIKEGGEIGAGDKTKEKNATGNNDNNKEKKTKKEGGEKVAKKDAKKSPEKTPENPAAAAAGNIDVSKLDLRVGLIVSAKKHPDADKQYVEEVNVGDGEGRNRTVVSGLVNYMPVEAIENRLAIFLCNLKPAKIRGVMSEAMLVCACTPDKVELLDPPAGCVPGDRVTCAQFPGTAEPLLNPKKKIWETVKPDLRTNNNCVASFKGQVLVVEGKGEVKAPSLADAQLS